MKKYLYLALLVPFFFSCNKNSENVAIHNNPRKDIVLTKSQELLVKNGNQFALNVLGKYNDSFDGSFVFSPMSLQFSLGMVLNATDGDTHDEILNVLDFPDNTAEANDFYKSLITIIPSLDKISTIDLNNAVFLNENSKIKDSYINCVKDIFSAKVKTIPYSEEGLKEINNWLNTYSARDSSPFLNSLDEGFVAYMLNATSFTGEWGKCFDSSRTKLFKFTDEHSSKKDVMMMFKEDETPVALLDAYSMIELYYGNKAFAMDVILPNKDTSIKEVLSNLQKDGLPSIKDNSLHYFGNCNIFLPRFSITNKTSFKNTLLSLGISLAFNNGDFSQLTNEECALKDIIQSTSIKVDEKGTVAKAATNATVVGETSTGEALNFVADRTFLFFIKETSTGAILFAGKYDGD